MNNSDQLSKLNDRIDVLTGSIYFLLSLCLNQMQFLKISSHEELIKRIQADMDSIKKDSRVDIDSIRKSVDDCCLGAKIEYLNREKNYLTR